jgi:hypothetical protein
MTITLNQFLPCLGAWAEASQDKRLVESDERVASWTKTHHTLSTEPGRAGTPIGCLSLALFHPFVGDWLRAATSICPSHNFSTQKI